MKTGASWVLAEGADACKLARSIPMSKIMEDALVAYAQNGEPLRPEQGIRCDSSFQAGKAMRT